MKRIFSFVVCLFVVFSAAACTSDNNSLSLLSGNYYAVGDYEEMLTPYLRLDTEENSFSFGGGALISYAENGTYEVIKRKIIATSQSTTFEFEIIDEKTLVLTDNGDNEYYKIPINTRFVFSENLE